MENYNCFFVTTTFRNWLKILMNEKYYMIVVESIKFCLKKYNCDLIAYVLMPNHIHLILFYNDKVDVSGFMRDMKKYTSVKLRQCLELDDMHKVEMLKYKKCGQKFKVWKDRFDAVIIRHRSVLITKVEYIHNNPIKAEFVDYPEEWKYSSAMYYATNEEGVLPVRHLGNT